MPKPIRGFLAEDGTFFQDSNECERHDAKNALLRSFENSHSFRDFPTTVYEAVLRFMENCPELVIRYCKTFPQIMEPINAIDNIEEPTTSQDQEGSS